MVFVCISLIFVTDADKNQLEYNLQGLRVEVLHGRMKPRGDHYLAHCPSVFNCPHSIHFQALAVALASATTAFELTKTNYGGNNGQVFNLTYVLQVSDKLHRIFEIYNFQYHMGGPILQKVAL